MNNFNNILNENNKSLESDIIGEMKDVIENSLYEYTSWDAFCEDRELKWDELHPILIKVWKRIKNKIK